MFRYRLIMACVATLASCTGAFLRADQLSPEVLSKVKQATVFVRASTPTGENQGTGFFVAEDMVVTNAHVLGMKDDRAPKPSKVSLIMNSGIAEKEAELFGEVVFVDISEDLAFVKVAIQRGIAPLELVRSEEVLETQPVHIVGYPLGAILTAGSNPSVTVAKGSISNIRRNKYSQIEALQIDGSIIPGNSGGPIVDAKGRLVGVSVAAVRGTQIGFSIPADSVRADMGGRVDTVSLTNHLLGGGTFSVDARITVIDPLGRIDSMSIYYWFCPLNTERPLDPKGKFATHGAKGDSAKTELKLSFNPSTNEWTGSIPKFHLADDQDFWVQPAIEIGQEIRLASAMNPSADMRGRSQEMAGAVASSAGDRMGPDRSGGSSPGKLNGMPAPKLGKRVPRKLVEPIKVDRPRVVNATIDHDEHGHRFTRVTSAAEKIQLGSSPMIQMVTDPSGQSLYAIFEGDSSVKVFDTKAMKLTHEIPVAKSPVALWCDDSRIVVACDQSKIVAFIDSKSHEIKKIVRLQNRELIPGRIPGLAPDGSIMSLWQSKDSASWETYLYLLHEEREPVEFVKGDIQWCAFTGFEDNLWTQHNFRGSPSGVANLIVDGKADPTLSRRPVFSSFGGLNRDMGHAFPTLDGKRFVIPISAQGMPDTRGYAAKTMVMSPDLSKIDLWFPGSAICEEPSQGIYVAWRDMATKDNLDHSPEVIYVSASNGRIIRRVSITGMNVHPAYFIVRNATSNIVYIPGREYFLFHDATMRTGQIDLVRCGPVEKQYEVSPDPNMHASNDPPQIIYVGKPFGFTPTFTPPADAGYVLFRLKKGVKGMEVDSKTGRLSFMPTETNLGLHDIEVVAEVDLIEMPVVKWTLEIDFAP